MISFLITLASTGLLIAIDQGIKMWATTSLQPVGTMPFIPGIVEFRYVLNDGAAFNILGGKQGFLIAFTAIALLVIFGYLVLKRPAQTLEYISWLLILGGGMGNLIDRVRNQVVVDYLSLQFMNFAVFNFADICVCVGVGLLALCLVLEEVKLHRQKKQQENPDAAV